jgi:hypothetical protein
MELCCLHDIAKQRVAFRDRGDVACQPAQDRVQGWVKGRRIRLRRGWRGIRTNTIGFRGDRDITRRRLGRDRRRLRLKPMDPFARRLAARQHRPGRPAAAEPGDVDGGIVAGGFARRQFAPDFDRGLGFLDILEKRAFAEVAAPAAGFEQLGQIFQPPFGKIAPARDGIAAACHVCSMSHESARKEKNGRRRNGDESIGRDRDILWKTFVLSSDRCAEAPGTKAKMRDPSGGTAGRVKLYGRLGWMGACAEYSLDGEGFYRSHLYWSRRVAERSNGPPFFYGAAGRLASRTAALSEAMAAPGAFKSLVMGTC